MVTLKERFQSLIEKAENNSNDIHCFKFIRLAMENPENFQLALAVKEQWNQEHSNVVYPPLASLIKDKLYQKFMLGHTLPWIADPNIKFLRIEKKGSHNWDGLRGFYNVAVYNVDGTEKACTYWDEKTMEPLPMGIAYNRRR
ncbi:MAG: hypothetical protein KAS66_00055 [Candidatus Omnitrophica bacterium]|nr:hypothetical protein [Candidatus Omnitrophota bacterium]